MSNILRLCSVFLGSAVLLAAQNPNRSPYIIKSGDTLGVIVFGQGNLTRTVLVDAEGAVTLPLMGKVKAEGLNVSQFAQRIKDALGPYIVNPEVSTYVQKIGSAAPAKTPN
jgi:protein involved in polysaccharide export with SLBB domain